MLDDAHLHDTCELKLFDDDQLKEAQCIQIINFDSENRSGQNGKRCKIFFT